MSPAISFSNPAKPSPLNPVRTLPKTVKKINLIKVDSKKKKFKKVNVRELLENE